jgi:hypothetical protein
MERTSRYNDPTDPFRPVDWRWRWAADVVDNDLPLSAEADDAGVWEAVRFLQAYRACKEADRRRLAQEMPALYGAHRIYLATDSFGRWEIEARLLTEESLAQIGEKCGISPNIIGTYHDTFFHVRDRLHSQGYIHHVVLGPKVHAGLTEVDVDVILKMYAYAAGALVVDALVDCYRNPSVVPEHPEALTSAELEALRTKLLLKASIRAHTLPANASGLKKMAVLDEAVKVIRSASRTGGVGSMPTPIEISLGKVHRFASQGERTNPPLVALLEPLGAA